MADDHVTNLTHLIWLGLTTATWLQVQDVTNTVPREDVVTSADPLRESKPKKHGAEFVEPERAISRIAEQTFEELFEAVTGEDGKRRGSHVRSTL